MHTVEALETVDIQHPVEGRQVPREEIVPAIDDLTPPECRTKGRQPLRVRCRRPPRGRGDLGVGVAGLDGRLVRGNGQLRRRTPRRVRPAAVRKRRPAAHAVISAEYARGSALATPDRDASLTARRRRSTPAVTSTAVATGPLDRGTCSQSGWRGGREPHRWPPSVRRAARSWCATSA